MLIEDEWKRIYFNPKIRKIIPFHKTLNPNGGEETTVILKKFLNKDCGNNPVSMFAIQHYDQNPEHYKNPASHYYFTPVNFINEFLDHMFPNSIINCCILISLKRKNGSRKD